MRLGIPRSGNKQEIALVRKGGTLIPVNKILERSSSSIVDLLLDTRAVSDLNGFESESSSLKKEFEFRKPLSWAAPIVPVRNVICVGKNYDAHIKERAKAGDSLRPTEKDPIFFTKATTSIIGSGENIVAWHATSKLDYEAELAIIIGKKGRGIAKERVQDYILGFSLLNDVSARDVQDAHRQWFRGKSLDTFCPIGPYVVTCDEIDWPVNVNITLSVNGEVRQDFWTKDMIFDIPTIISELSKGLTLLPGDVIATGTADGCGVGFSPPRFLKPGDKILINCEELGTLENQVVAE
jgi:2-keto-4-pentenoate hydratase/2-oxohepta-3-ene-1,7-dioic acid hydratase in catechol pathway